MFVSLMLLEICDKIAANQIKEKVVTYENGRWLAFRVILKIYKSIVIPFIKLSSLKLMKWLELSISKIVVANKYKD